MSIETFELSRRSLLKSFGVGTAASLGVLSLDAAAEQRMKYDEVYDVVVCGSGGGGLATALFSAWKGNSVQVIEKAGNIGGTTAKAAFWYWIPNNMAMRRKGIADPKEDFLKLVARLSASTTYNENAKFYGLNEWQYKMCSAFYDSGSEAAELLHKKGALRYKHVMVDDYWSELPENKAPKGRVLVPDGVSESMFDGGQIAIRSLSQAARKEGVNIKTSCRVMRLITNGKGDVLGVEATTELGDTYRVKANKGVVFATGGFTHNVTIRENYLSSPIYGGCAALTNEGDVLGITAGAGVQLANMNYAWNCPVSLEKAIAKDGSMSGEFTPVGDSMFSVNKYGKRVFNEKLCYNEKSPYYCQWDGTKAEYPNIVMISIWDQRSQENSASNDYGALIVPPGADDRHVIKGDSLNELVNNISLRLEKYKRYTNVELSSDFLSNLRDTITKFNRFALEGKDEDFQRGERAVELLFNGHTKIEKSRINQTMWPMSDSGPYYAALTVPGTLDTKGGPKTDPDCRMLDVNDEPIKGLYGVGNCVASASGRAYWAGGATIGPIIAFSYRAANAVDSEKRTA